MVFILFYLASSAMAFDFIHNKTILSDLKACKLLIDSLPIVGHICRISQLHYLSMATTSIIPPIRHTSDTFCQGCLRTFFAVIQNQTLDFVAHGFFARFTEMDFDAVGGLSDFLYHYRWRGFLYGQRGSGCGGAAVAGVVVHRLSFP